MSEVINWLLEDSNPEVKYRTQTELLGQIGDKEPVVAWIFDKLPKDWLETKGLWFNYYITAFAECGLSHEDIPKEAIEKAFAIYDYFLNRNLFYRSTDKTELVIGGRESVRLVRTYV